MTSITSYLENLPLHEIVRCTKEFSKNGISFIGYPRQYPSDKTKIILIQDPLGDNPLLMEFKIEDVLGAEELHSAVTTDGETAPLVKLWIRKGAKGVMLEPFEVDEPIRFVNKKARNLSDKVFQQH